MYILCCFCSSGQNVGRAHFIYSTNEMQITCYSHFKTHTCSQDLTLINVDADTDFPTLTQDRKVFGLPFVCRLSH